MSSVTNLQFTMDANLVNDKISTSSPVAVVPEETEDCYEFPFQDTNFLSSVLNLAASTPATINSLFESYAKLQQIESPKFLDLGCGDGRLVVHAAMSGFLAVGIDLDPLNIDKCKALAKLHGVSDLCDFILADIFTFDLSGYNYISCYLYKKTLSLLSHRLWDRLQDGNCIIATILYKPKKWIPMLTDHVFKIYFFDEKTELQK